MNLVRLTLVCATVLVAAATATAEVVQTITLENVPSVSVAGDAGNSQHFFEVTTPTPFSLGAISWSGLATPLEDPDPGPGEPAFPTWGTDLRARITHDPSGEAADVILGYDGRFGPEAALFASTSMDLSGIFVQPGDRFSLEFFEEVDDPGVSPDAIWDSIAFHIDDDRPGADVIRFDTTGSRTWRTIEGQPGAGFYGLEYGEGGAGPSITNVRLEGHDLQTFWFDLRIETHGIDDGGQFRANVLDGVGDLSATFLDEDPTLHPDTGEPLFADTFGTLELEFAPGDFEPGDRIRFGVLTYTDDQERFTRGDEMAELRFSGPLSVTVTFDDGTKVTAPLEQVHPDRPQSAFVDLEVGGRALPSGGDTDGDGDVDGHDLLDTFLGFGIRSGALPADGDADGQGDVDDDDFAIVAANLGSGVGSPVATGVSSGGGVPEPASYALLLLGLACAARWVVLERRR